VRFVFQSVLQREPSAAEMEAARAFLNAAPEALVETNALVDAVEAGTAKRKAGAAVAPSRPLTPFERYAQVVLLTNEFMYIR
jgi:phosphoglycerate dehydrogenase-like enzyme